MLINIHVKVNQDILNSSYRADTTRMQILLFSVSKGHNSKNTQSRVMVLVFCRSSHVD